MPKLPHQSTTEPLESRDAASKSYADSSGGGSSPSGIAVNSQSANFVKASSQRATGGDTAVFDGLAAATIEAWVRPATFTGGTIVSKSTNSDPNWTFRFYLTTATSMNAVFSANGSSTGASVNQGGFSFAAGTWTHVAVTWDGATGEVNFFENGVQVSTPGALFAQTGTLANTISAFVIGGDDGSGAEFDGDISEVRIWDFVKSEAEIADNYLRSMSGGETGIVTLHHLDGSFRDAGPSSVALTGVNSPTFTSVVPWGSPAQSVLTADGTLVDIVSVSPVPGQALVADSATSASWQDVAASGASVAAQGDYITVVLNHNHDAVVNSPVEFDVESEKRGSLALDAVNYRITGLKAGRTYLIQAQIRVQFESGTFKPYDVTNGAYLDTEIGCQPIHVTRSDNTSSTPIASMVHTPLTDIAIEMRCEGILSATCDVHAGNTWLQVIEIGAVQAEVVGGLEFMDIITVGAATASVTFGAGGDGAFQRPLDGDVDEEYILVHRTIKTSTMTTLDLRPNGVTANQVSRRVTHQSSTVTFPRLVVAQPAAAGLEYGELSFEAATGLLMRSYRSHNALQGADPATEAQEFSRSYAGTWDENATNITSLVLATDDASVGIDAGSQYVLYRRTRSNLRSDMANSYERTVSAAVPEGTDTAEYTTGLAVHGGSVVGVSALLQDAVTAGTVTINVKVEGTTVMSTVLDTTNTTKNSSRSSIGINPVAAADEVSVEVVTSGYTNAGSVTSGIVVQVGLVNSSLLLDGSSARRSATDSSDLLVFAGDVDGSNDLINTGADATIAIPDSNSPEERVGFFDRSAAALTRATDNLWRGASTVQPASITVSTWVYVYEDLGLQWFIVKRYNNASWVSPFAAVDLVMNSNLAFDVTISGTRDGAAAAYSLIPLSWNHLGGTFDPSTGLLSLYLNGQLVASKTHSGGAGAIDYGSGGDWVVGGNGAGNSENSNSAFSDVRIANVVRSAAYFEDIWRRGLRLT